MDPKTLEIAKAIAAYLLNRDIKLKISGPTDKVLNLHNKLRKLKELIYKMVPSEDSAIKENAIIKEGALKSLVAGIIGYLVGKGTGVKIKGAKESVKSMVDAINNVKNALISSPREIKKW